MNDHRKVFTWDHLKNFYNIEKQDIVQTYDIF